MLLALLISAALPATAQDGYFRRALTVSGAVELNIENNSGDIVVHDGPPGSVTVIGRIRIKNSLFSGGDLQGRIRQLESNPPLLHNGNSIRIEPIRDIALSRRLSIHYELVVPAETRMASRTGSGDQTVEGLRGPIRLHTGSGDLKLTSIGGDIEVDTGSGDVTLEDIRAGAQAQTGSGDIRAMGIRGGLRARTGSGDVRLRQLDGGPIVVSTGSGEVHMSDIVGALEASTGSGDIRVEGEPTGPWKIHAGSGDVLLRIPFDVGFQLDAETTSGRIQTDRPMQHTRSAGRTRVHGTVGDGSVSLTVRTGSGDIEIR